MKILVINWRSIKDPAAGGAEQVTFEHAKRWVAEYGADVIWLAPKYDRNKSEEIIEGVNFRYIGIPLGVTIGRLIYTYPIFFIGVFLAYIFKYKRKVDIIVECVHGIPLLTKFYVNKPVVVYLQEVAGNIWDKMFTFPINFIGKWTEKFFIRLYRQNTFVVGSKSAKDDLISLGISDQKIHIVNHGVQLSVFEGESKKEKDLTLIFLNRMVKMKGVERALMVFEKLKQHNPDAKLWLVGKYDDEYRKHLEKIAKKLKIGNSIRFFGFVTDDEKVRLLRSAHVLINTSYKEGWGLCNIEANRQGTPVAAYDVEGNRDSIKHGVSGYLVPDDDIDRMVDAILDLYKNNEIAKTAKDYSRQFSWEDKSEQFFTLLKQECVNGRNK